MISCGPPAQFRLDTIPHGKPSLVDGQLVVADGLDQGEEGRGRCIVAEGCTDDTDEAHTRSEKGTSVTERAGFVVLAGRGTAKAPESAATALLQRR